MEQPPTPQTQTPAVETGQPKTDVISDDGAITTKKFQNGWTQELEELIADWGDKALVYRWLHERTSLLFKNNDQGLMIPVIVLSTLTGTANFGMGSFFGNDANGQRIAQLGVGGISIIAGVLTTLANYYGYSKCAETHRTSGVSWGKFNRFISIELRLHPDERMDSKSFLKMFRIELDRLIEQAPSIPNAVINEFKILFEDSDVHLPDILGVMEHTKIFADSNSRLKKVAVEAALAIQQKKGILKQLVLDDLDDKIQKICRKEINKITNQDAMSEITDSSMASPRLHNIIVKV
jgi:hypothetical protein